MSEVRVGEWHRRSGHGDVSHEVAVVFGSQAERSLAQEPNATPTRTTAFATGPILASVHDGTMTIIEITAAVAPITHHPRG